MKYAFCLLLLALTASCASQPPPPQKLPEQFLGYWGPDDPHSCVGVNIHADGRINSVCDADSSLVLAERYTFDCSPDPKTAYIIIERRKGWEYTPYYKLQIKDQYLAHSGYLFLDIYDMGDAEKEQASPGKKD